jgi:hypothetical protein
VACERLAMAVPAAAGRARVLDLAMVEAPVATDAP